MLPALPPALLRSARSALLPALTELAGSNTWASSSSSYATDAEAASPTSREHILSRLGSTIGQQRAGPRAPRRPQQAVAANTGGGRGAGPTPLSPAMESLKMGFFKFINSDPGSDSPGHRQQCLDAVKGLLHVLQEGMQQAKQSAQGVGTLPRDFWADKEMFNHAFKVLARYYKLPVDNFGRSEYTLRPDQDRSLEAARKMKALYAAMEATPSIWIDSWHVDYMLCAWRFAGKPDEVKVLLDRHLEHADTGRAYPHNDGFRHAFFALKESFDVEGMWSLLSSLASRPELLNSPLFILVPRFVHMLVVAAAQGRCWDIVKGVQLLMRQLRSSREGQQLSMTFSGRVMVMAHAAQDDQLHIARDMLEQVAQESKVMPMEYIQQWRRQQELQDMRNSESGQSSSSTQSSGRQDTHRARSKVNEGVLLEVLHACARWPNVGEAKALAHKAFETLEQTLPVSNFHPPAYYMKLMGTTPEAEQQELPPPAPRAFSIPSVAAHHALIHVLARAHDWPALFDMIARLEKMVEEGLARPASLSVHRGLGCAAEGVAQASAGVKAAAATAYNVLTLRQASGQLVSCAMMNVVLRGLALGGEVDACGRLFEEYKVAGLPHDFAAYNAVIESCCVAKKPQAAYGVLDYMATQNVKPGTDSYDLLLRAFVSAGDVDGALEALRRGRADNARTRYGPIQAALSLARQKGNASAVREFLEEIMALDAREREQQTQLLQQQQQQQLRQQGDARAGPAPDTAAAAAGAAAAGVGAYEQVQAGLDGYEGYEQGDATGGEQGAEFGYEEGLEGGGQVEGELEAGQVLEDEVGVVDPLEEGDEGGGGYGIEGSGFEDDDRL